MLALYRRYLDAKEKIKGLMTDDEGQTIVEYVLLIVLIALVVLASSPSITDALIGAFSRIADSMAAPAGS
jgi:Flp pilus assembly pilin Flp